MNLNQQLFNYEYENFDQTIAWDWPPKNDSYFRKSIEAEDSLALVVVMGKKIVGYLIGSIGKGENYRSIKKIGELDNMFILPEARGKGIGSALCQEFLKWVKDKGVKRVKVVASAKNKQAIACYKRNGFFEYNCELECEL